MGAASKAMAPKMLRTPSDNSTQGFTLVEMAAVMTIVAMMAALVVMMRPGVGRPELKALTLDAASLLRQTRMEAILSKGDRAVRLDGQQRALIGAGVGAVRIPDDVTVDVLGEDDSAAEDEPRLIFHADGGSSGGVFRFSREAAQYDVRVNWYTGGVSVGAP
jgi:general secretion pathway protein H